MEWDYDKSKLSVKEQKEFERILSIAWITAVTVSFIAVLIVSAFVVWGAIIDLIRIGKYLTK